MLFRKRKNSQQVGRECAQVFATLIRRIPDMISELPDSENVPFASIEDIDEDLLYRELVILAYVGERLAIQHAPHPEEKLREVCNAFDEATSEFFPRDWDDILDKRGMQYFTLLIRILVISKVVNGVDSRRNSPPSSASFALVAAAKTPPSSFLILTP